MTRRNSDTDRLLELADTLAGTWAGRAGGSTTAGRERALLRLFGVHGVDRSGTPLAGEVVDRYLGRSPMRLAGGVALPFAMAAVEYDLSAQEVALDVAGGKIDLRLEADLLADPERRAAAEAMASSLADGALDRIDANRTARSELLDLLGDAAEPWVGLSIAEAALDPARSRLERLVDAGADALRIPTPAGRELTDRLYDAGVTADAWRPRQPEAQGIPAEPTPAGSQRGLAELREVADRKAAERGAYVRLASSAPPLAAPEQAVVAAFERLDVVAVDPFGEIVEASVDPDRALADHAFANWLQQRAGTLVAIGPGPLVVAGDLRRGVPSSLASRAGRGLALQALTVALARRHGLPSDQLIVGALPGWLADEPEPVPLALAHVALRRALYPDLRLALDDGAGPPAAAPMRSILLATLLSQAGEVALVERGSVGERDPRALVEWTRAAALVGRAGAASIGPSTLRGTAGEFADAILASATETLGRLAEDGWDAILGEPVGGPDRPRLGADAVVERTESFDPFAPTTRIAEGG